MSFSCYRLSSSMLGLRSMRSGAFTRISSGGLPKLKSGSLTNSKSSAKGGLSISRSYISSVVSQIINSDVSDTGDVSDKAESGLTKEYVSALEKQAREDAAAGVYGKDGKANALRSAHMAKYVSPDRDAAIAQANKLLVSGALGAAGSGTTKLTGLPYTARVSRGASGITAALYDENGEKFASFDGKSGKWTPVITKAESQFQTASSSIYDAAYRAAQPGADGGMDSGTSSGLNVRA